MSRDGCMAGGEGSIEQAGAIIMGLTTFAMAGASDTFVTAYSSRPNRAAFVIVVRDYHAGRDATAGITGGD